MLRRRHFLSILQVGRAPLTFGRSKARENDKLIGFTRPFGAHRDRDRITDALTALLRANRRRGVPGIRRCGGGAPPTALGLSHRAPRAGTPRQTTDIYPRATLERELRTFARERKAKNSKAVL